MHDRIKLSMKKFENGKLAREKNFKNYVTLLETRLNLI